MLLMLDVAVRRAAARRRHAVRRCQIDESMQRWLPGRFPFGFQGEVTHLEAGNSQTPRSRAKPLDPQTTPCRRRSEESAALRASGM